MEIIKWKILIVAMCFIINGFTKAQNIKMHLSFNQRKQINIDIESIHNRKIGANLEYANERWKEISKNGLSENQLYLFIYDKDKLIDNSVAQKNIQPSEPPIYYEKRKNDAEIKKNAKINLCSKKLKNLQYNLLVYPNVDAVFKDNPCKIFNCWYEFYSLEKGKKYRMQIQLKVKSKIYKSNFVEFTY